MRPETIAIPMGVRRLSPTETNASLRWSNLQLAYAVP